MAEEELLLNKNETTEKAALSLWAKSHPYKQLLSHMIDTGCCAMQYLRAKSSQSVLCFLMDQSALPKDEICSFAAYLAAMHDVGKAMPWFQKNDDVQYQRMKDAGLDYLFSSHTLNPIQHEYLSARAFKRVWKQRSENRRLMDAYAAVLFLHHQRNDNSRLERIPDDWVPIQDCLEVKVRVFFHMGEHLPQVKNLDAAGILLSALVILSDWVASSGPFDHMPCITPDYYDRSMETACRALHRYGLISDRDHPEIHSFHSLWPMISTPRDIQRKCETLDMSSPITVIEAPMGEGKTEAALFLAESICHKENKRGIYVALPTQATSNQMYGRTKAMLESIHGGFARLLHGTAFLMQDEKHIQIDTGDDRQEAERWLGTSRMGLLDENGVGTVDQAMAGVLRARFSILRLLGLQNKVLIIDEMHAYDAYMSEIIQSLLKWCKVLHVPVVLLSATLQSSQRREYLSCFMMDNNQVRLSDHYPLITQVDHNGHITQTEAKASMETAYEYIPVRLGEDDDAIAEYALQQIVSGGCYCVLVNTVNRAQSVYRSVLNRKGDDVRTCLFHARFTIGRREEIEKLCLRSFGKGPESDRPEKAVLVATQVVEQSLDLDFDGMLSELAPIDLLLQRAGRVHRHRNRQRPAGMEKPVIQVIMPDEDADENPEKRYGSSSYVYAPFLLNNTEHLLEEAKTICVPGEVRSVIENVYEDVHAENLRTWQEREFSQDLMRANAGGNCFPDPREATFFPSQSHPEFVQMEVDDGFEPASRASTRLGEPTIRIAFVTPELLSAAKNEQLTKEMQNEIFYASVSLPGKWISGGDLENSELFRIRKGALNGCYLTDHADRIQIGNRVLLNDQIFGVMWEGK